MRGKQLKIILAVSGCLIIATAFNNCGNPIGSPILLKAASSGGQIGDDQCFTLPAAKPGPITRLAAQPMVSPFSSQKVVVASQNETSNDYVALVSHNCLRGQNASTRADLFSAKVSSRATAVTEE